MGSRVSHTPRRPPHLGACAALLLPAAAWADYAINLQPPATRIAREIYALHNTIVAICAAIFVVVLVPMIIALVRHRKAAGHPPAHFHDHTPLEITWTVIPILILLAMAWPATRLIIDMKDTGAADVTIKVTGHQWKWEYEYLGDELRYISTLSTSPEQRNNLAPKDADYLLAVDKPLVVPTGKKIRLVLTASDVIHSWWIPAFGVKQDAIPGFIRDTWFTVDEPGTYRGQCAELCGVGHGYMPIVVEALPPERYAAWMSEQKTRLAAAAADANKTFSLAELQARGEQVYGANCVACHQASGAGVPGAFPALNGSPVVQGDKAAHLERVFHGKPGTAMAAFGQQLSDLDIAAVITFERNHWNNHTGDTVQPAEVATLRQPKGAR